MTLQNVHLRVNDTATGRPTPVRLRVTDAAGAYYAPFGRPADFPMGVDEDVGGGVCVAADPEASTRDRWAYIDGTCEIAVPTGDLTIEVRKGPEYRPLRQTVTLPPGKMALRFAVERWTDLRAEGWYSGDTRAHSLTPHAALLEAAAEDLSVVHLLAHQQVVVDGVGTDPIYYTTYPNLIAFSGQQPCVAADRHQVFVGTHNRHHALGNLALLNCHRIVYPLTFGPGRDKTDWSLADWCNQCHRKNGLVVWTDAFGVQSAHGGEALADLLLGRIDALEWVADCHDRLRPWYHLLNAGFHVPLAGASAKDSNGVRLGAMRTYARLADATAYSPLAWIEAVRAGRTFVSAGPLVRFTVDGHGPGSVIDHPDDGAPLRVSVRAKGVEPFSRVELVQNRDCVAGGETAIDTERPAGPGGWLAARCWRDGRIVAHTSPVYVRVGGRPSPASRDAFAALDAYLLHGRHWAERFGGFTPGRPLQHVLGIFDAARQVLLARIGESATIAGPATATPAGDDG
jgi:hypothetical protein